MKEGRTRTAAEAFLEGLKYDQSAMDMSPAEQSILGYTLKLTRTPSKIVREDVDALRVQGLEDRAIHDLACIVGYFAFVNRVADGLGVELESGRDG